MCSRRKMETSCKTYFMSGKIKELRKKEMSKKVKLFSTKLDENSKVAYRQCPLHGNVKE